MDIFELGTQSEADPSLSTLSGMVEECGSSLTELFGGHLKDYGDPNHQVLEEKLQSILESTGDFALGINVNIDQMHGEMRRSEGARLKKSSKKDLRKTGQRHVKTGTG